MSEQDTHGLIQDALGAAHDALTPPRNDEEREALELVKAALERMRTLPIER